MNTKPLIEAWLPDLIAWRHDFHAHPETAFEEVRTAARVAELLQSFGIDVHTGIGRTGVVGVLRSGTSQRCIGLRADMDALCVHEANAFSHRSQHNGRMHACGHDGHTAMLLGAARYLAETRHFDGTVNFIFQPAEENEGGGREMLEDGLFERFPCDAVYGLHNWPGMAVGHFGIMPGPMMASYDIFEITVKGRGAHAAMPHNGIDPVTLAASVVHELQTIASRNVPPVDAAVVSVTQIHGGDTWNVISPEVVLRGTTRAFKPEVQDLIEQRMRQICQGLATAHQAEIALRYERRYPPTVNSVAEAGIATKVMRQVAGGENVHTDLQPTMGAEDFAFLLQKRPGAYGWIGNGPGVTGCLLHNPNYDFNDDILPLGVAYWAALAQEKLNLPTDATSSL